MSSTRRQRRANGRTDGLRLIEETANEVIYAAKYNGHDIRFIKDKATGQIMANMDDMARAHGLTDANAWLSSDAGLDAILESQKTNPGERLILKK